MRSVIVLLSRYLKRFGIKAITYIPTRKGAVLSEEVKDKIRKAHLGKKMSLESNQKKREWMLENNPFRGKKHTEDSKQRQRDRMLGRKLSLEHKEKVIKTLRNGTGKDNPNWKGGTTPEDIKFRNSDEYKEWRTNVFVRDDYTCRFCGQKGGGLNADHIAPFALYPELRLSSDNGRTLCVNCHRKTETYGGNSNKKH